jgi:Arc/MetJ-type ribon-helix-helix transcriptional regulator
MRNALTISLPDAIYKDIQKNVKKGNFASVSEYIRYVLRTHAENQLVKELRNSSKAFAKGKGKEFTVKELDTW